MNGLKFLFLSVAAVGVVSAIPFHTDKIPALITAVEEGLYRITNETKPISYDVFLKTDIHLVDENDPAKFLFSGNVKITLRADEVTNSITLHAKSIVISDVTLTGADGPIDLAEPIIDEVHDFITFTVVNGDLTVGSEYVLSMSFTGRLQTDNQGFYSSYYTDKAGKKVWLATTQFEPTHTRLAFPVYDEPNIRAKFKITIDCGLPYYSVSNMPIANAREENDRLITEFAETVDTHPSILAFIISDFSYIGMEIKDETPQRIYARSEAILNGEADFALEAGVKIIRELEKQVDTKYSLPKLDQVSVPDFAAGAMENWGLVTYREEIFLYDEHKSSMAIKDKVATIVAHEYAHMFFGNLVSIKWWTYAWLKEGMATLFEYQATAAVYPQLRDEHFYVTREVHRALLSDASSNARPMSHYVESPANIAGIFDYVIYSKAGTVLRMIEHAISRETFLKGLKYYLNEMQFQAAGPEDLARNLQQAINEDQTLTGVTAQEMIDSWSLRAGYPIVNVALVDSELHFTQKKFSLIGEELTDKFIIPITFATESVPDFTNTKPDLWIKDNEQGAVTQGEKWKNGDWIVVNKQQTGFYRVNYDDKLWSIVTEKLMHDGRDKIHTLNRAQLVDDSLNLARSGYIDYPTALDLCRFLGHERDFPAWTAASSGFNFLNRQFLDSPVNENFKRYVGELISGVYHDLTLNDQGLSEDIGDKTLRNIAIRWACLTGNRDCIEETASKVNHIIEHPEQEIEPNTRETVYCYGLREADSTKWDAILHRLHDTEVLADRTVLVTALGCTQNSDIQKKYLLLSIESEDLRKTERNRILSSIYTNGGKSGLENSIKFIQEHHMKVEEVYNPPSPVKRAVTAMADLITSENLEEQFFVMVDALIADGALTAADKTTLLKTTESNLAWLPENEEEISSFFANLFKSDANVPVATGILIVASCLLRFFM